MMIETVSQVERNDELSPGYRLLTVSFDEDVQTRSGQFAMIRPHNCMEPLLRRALAIYRSDGPRKLSFLYQVLGRGTTALSALRRGDLADTLVPLGNIWPVEGVASAIVVAGGIGSASVLMLCEQLARERIKTRIFFGAGSGTVAAGCGLEDFRALRLPLTLTTDDGSLGHKGLVTEPLKEYLEKGGEKDARIYTCGPWVMMKRVAEIASESGVECYASLEAPMGCGFGVCVGCVVAVKTDGPPGYGSYKRVCIDGPVFPAEAIRWEVAAMTH
ncbi:MAG TPA: dihydroorotate dehydrogenase electron transfer subunit [Blastocatellia bacterium]|nr:dihydroorotate dehydrogenase electron transfer subunit [Blastocatellia bacterium]